MSTSYSPKIVTSGLSVNFDAANKNSYPGSGNYWYNLGSNGGYLQAGLYTPAYTTLGGVTCLNFNQEGAGFSGSGFFAASFPPDQTNLSIETWLYPSSTVGSGDRGCICRAALSGNAWYHSFYKTNYKLSNYWYGKSPEGYFETGAALNLDAWNHVVAVFDASNIYQYTNLVKTSTACAGTAGLKQTGLQIGYESTRQFYGGITILRIYGIALTTDQIIQNYNATHTRFGF
jgi:hypothetical protein